MDVSVICPTYNRSEAIMRTIDSVRGQSLAAWELLVVSDGCTDDTEDWVRRAGRDDPRIRLYRIDRSGHPSGPRNHGLAHARGRVVAYLDHDDLWHADHLRVLLDAMEATGADLVAAGCEYRDDAGVVVSRLPPLGAFWHPQLQMVGPMFEPSRVAHRKGLAERVGGWRVGAGLEDWDLWLRMADAGVKVTTLLRPTAVLRYDLSTRRHRMTRRHRLPLASFDDPVIAHGVMRELLGDHNIDAFRVACEADMKDWMRQMAATPEFVRPLDWDGAVDAEIEREMILLGQIVQDIVMVPERRRFVLAKILSCSTAEHAERIATLAPVVQPRQFGLIREIARAVVQSQPRSRARNAA
ncbi:glycosyltransferase family 2 protein [Microbispora sp. RL4-1S]|uniref:Glycosyltransferase family 2 protein n=1 Tax=Microbispora oryzae TaxID=2806554 RepID=A0A941ASH5_9ACTN|nr:glycosyltransferase family 2 protein [Microbispora oryzae]